MSDSTKKEDTPEVPNSHLAEIHANDNKNVVQEKADAEKAEREAAKIAPGVNAHLADVHAGKVDAEGKSIETVTVPADETVKDAPADVERNGGPSSAPIGAAAETTETGSTETTTETDASTAEGTTSENTEAGSTEANTSENSGATSETPAN